MKWIITNKKGIPLSYFNSNCFVGKPKDTIGFSNKNYFSFETETDACNKIRLMFETLRLQEGIDLKLSIKLFNIFNKLKETKVL